MAPQELLRNLIRTAMLGRKLPPPACRIVYDAINWSGGKSSIFHLQVFPSDVCFPRSLKQQLPKSWGVPHHWEMELGPSPFGQVAQEWAPGPHPNVHGTWRTQGPSHIPAGLRCPPAGLGKPAGLPGA